MRDSSVVPLASASPQMTVLVDLTQQQTQHPLTLHRFRFSTRNSQEGELSHIVLGRKIS
jgi:hypothetical protein